jgi:hypothetical protein
VDNSSIPFTPDWVVSGDEIWLDEDTGGERENWLSPNEWPLASSGARFRARSIVSSKGLLSEIANKRKTSGRCTIFWTGLFPWLPWMQMGQRPGYLLWRSIGRKIRHPNEASPRILDFIAAREPDYLTLEDPWMDRKNSWIDFASSGSTQ